MKGRSLNDEQPDEESVPEWSVDGDDFESRDVPVSGCGAFFLAVVILLLALLIYAWFNWPSHNWMQSMGLEGVVQ